MAIRFRVAQFGSSFATRKRGEELRDQLLAQRPNDGELIIDFAGVTNVSYSFADEFVGKLVTDKSLRLELTNMMPTVQRSVERASARRSAVSVCH